FFKDPAKLIDLRRLRFACSLRSAEPRILQQFLKDRQTFFYLVSASQQQPKSLNSNHRSSAEPQILAHLFLHPQDPPQI
ncbi:MAG: hypothetical protein PGN26_14015, partial [Xylophilus ampelinus]